MFNTKQRVLILIAQPLKLIATNMENPTVRDIQRGLRQHFGIIRTRRHIRRLLRELDHEGIITRETRSRQPRPRFTQEQATKYEIVDFDRAFLNRPSLTRHARVFLARERRRRKRKEV